MLLKSSQRSSVKKGAIMEQKRYSVKFEYMDRFSHGRWNKQEGQFYGYNENDAVKKCKEVYGLGYDCDYIITEVKEI